MESMDIEDRSPVDIDRVNHGFGPIPEKRKKRAAFLSAALSFVVMVVLLAGFFPTEVVALCRREQHNETKR